MTAEAAEIRPRTAARLCAVQALYQIEMRGGSAESTIAEFLEHRLGDQDPHLTFARAAPTNDHLSPDMGHNLLTYCFQLPPPDL